MYFISRSPCRTMSFLILFFIALVLNPVWASNPETALDDYVNAPDLNFSYSLASPPQMGDGYMLYVFKMSSQQWRGFDELGQTVWTHWLVMIVPSVMSTDTAMLIIAGGHNFEPPELDATEVAVAAEIAKNSGSIVSVIGQIPNQPLFFADELFAHTEDEIVAYSFDKALDTGDWKWPAYLPMTKASVRAMDTIQAVTTDPAVTPIPVNDFIVTGFSKRGATTWLTAVVDSRVKAIAPGVFDILNMDEQVEHHFAAYGFYSDALNDYVNYNILRRIRTPEGQALMQVVDPISYKDRLTMPKFILNSSGDPFYTSDSARFYFNDLEGEKLIRYVANTGHDLETEPDNIEDAVTSLVSWYLNVIYNVPRPQISWHHEDGQLIVQTDRPAYARFWQAHNPTARDFRLDTIGRSWVPTPLSLTPQMSYAVPVPTPSVGWTAYFVDLIFPSLIEGVPPQTYSTSIYISPDTLPFEVTDPLLDPKGVGFWKRQVAVAQGAEGRAQVPADVLAGYFPIPLFDQYVTNIDDAAIIFSVSPSDPQAQARQQCLALRLNVRDGQLGWYTPLTIDDDESKKLWEYYAEAHEAYLADDPKAAKSLCATVNGI
ncbi:PhoPQ-activated pathogenicity-related family protein [Kaarinaea lacus]